MTTTKLGSFFQRSTRDDGTAYTALREDRPDWLQEAVYAAHGSSLPCDWVYETCRAACDAIDDGTLSEDTGSHEFADGQVDVYTKELAQWYADFCTSDLYAQADSDADDMGHEKQSVNERLTTVQYCAIARIADCILHASLENVGEGS